MKTITVTSDTALIDLSETMHTFPTHGDAGSPDIIKKLGEYREYHRIEVQKAKPRTGARTDLRPNLAAGSKEFGKASDRLAKARAKKKR